MHMPEYNTELANNVVSSLVKAASNKNETLLSAYDYLYDRAESSNVTNPGGSHQLAAILQQLFMKMADNHTQKGPLGSSLSSLLPSTLSSFSSPMVSFLPSSPNASNSYRLLSFISLWFVLIVNPIVILFGVTGNLLAIYILINCNIVKLPVSFYTIMLNISDTLNLLIPVFIFWLDNCFNRTPERGYFRDKSNFLCKALMCPDQLFAALSAWYMCAISFNRWYSVCRPSSYFFRITSNNPIVGSSTLNNTNTDNNRRSKKNSATSTSSTSSSLFSVYFLFDYCGCSTHHIKLRPHLQAFRSIAFITLLGILCCLYPIFMHELRPVISTNAHIFDLTHKITHTYAVVWKRCYYSRKHERAYDVIGIILSCFLHILPLTFVGAMNLMIIIRLRQRQRLMSVSAGTSHTPLLLNKKKNAMIIDSQKRTSNMSVGSQSKKSVSMTTQQGRKSNVRLESLPTICKDQATSTDLTLHPHLIQTQPSTASLISTTTRRHYSRDRTITIMLVSVALSYLILTLPYRLFWSYNVYIKRIHPERLNSSIYLLKMHYIDHVLRTIRNIHYGTNFVFFIFLSKTFRRKFRQLFIEKFLHTTRRFSNKDNNNNNNNHNDDAFEDANHSTANKDFRKTRQQRYLSRATGDKRAKSALNNLHAAQMEYASESMFNGIPSSAVRAGGGMYEEIVPIIVREHNNLPQYDGE